MAGVTHYRDAEDALDRAGRAEIGEGYESYLLGVAQAKATLSLVDGLAEVAAELYRIRIAVEVLAGHELDRELDRTRKRIEPELVIEGEKIDESDGPVVTTIADLAAEHGAEIKTWEPAAKRWPIEPVGP